MNAPLPSTQDRLRGLLQSLSTGLIERDPALRLVLLAALAGEHILLLGPPGPALAIDDCIIRCSPYPKRTILIETECQATPGRAMIENRAVQ